MEDTWRANVRLSQVQLKGVVTTVVREKGQ